ncbi:MAG TPA: hypothetical protein VLE96_07130 [Chlamydiales bacterium]|nr:hypothetical protein [Chlamydiales bacterium]
MHDVPYHYPAKYIPSPVAKLVASLIKFPVENKVESYQELVCTEADKVKIYEIITTMADNNKISLLLKQNHLKGLGAQINHVHGLKFLSTIIAHPHLKVCLSQIFDDYFKRNGFLDGLGPSLTREADKGKLDQYINDFCVEVSTTREQLNGFFQARDWEGMVRLLIAQ